MKTLDDTMKILPKIYVEEFVATIINPGVVGYPYAERELGKIGIKGKAKVHKDVYSFAGELSSYLVELEKPVEYEEFLEWREILQNKGWYLNEDKAAVEALKALEKIGHYDKCYE